MVLLCSATIGLHRPGHASPADPHPYTIAAYDPLGYWNGTADCDGTTLSLRIYYGQLGEYDWEQHYYYDVTGRDVFVEWSGSPLTLANYFHTLHADTDLWYPQGWGPPLVQDNTYRWASPHWYDYDDFPGNERWAWLWCWAPGYDHASGLRNDVVATDYGNYELEAQLIDDRERVDIPSTDPTEWATENFDKVDDPLSAVTYVHAVGIDINPSSSVSLNPSGTVSLDYLPVGKTIGLVATVRGDLPEAHRRGVPSWSCSSNLRFMANGVLSTAASGYGTDLVAIGASDALNDQWVRVQLDADRLNSQSTPVFTLSKVHNLTAFTMDLKVTHNGQPDPWRMYVQPTPSSESADGYLFSTWPDEILRVTVWLQPTALASNLPSGFLRWQAASVSIPDNTINHTFSWALAGTLQVVQVSVPACDILRMVHVDVPDVGSTNQYEALLLALGMFGPDVLMQIDDYRHESQSWAGDLSHAGRDAIRHTYVSSLCASDSTTGEAAEMIAMGHERTGYETYSHAFDSTMDLHNNEVGRGIVHSHIASDEDGDYLPDRLLIQQDVLRAYSTGEVWIWDGPNRADLSEGVLLKSNGTTIY